MDGKKIFHANGNQEKVRVVILILEKYTSNRLIKEKDGQYIVIKSQSNKKI